jgi:hypothetical protein
MFQSMDTDRPSAPNASGRWATFVKSQYMTPSGFPCAMKSFRYYLLVFAAFTQCLFGAVTKDQLRFWSETLQAGDLAAINATASAKNGRWPPVRSASWRQNDDTDETRLNLQFSTLAKSLLDGIETYSRALDTKGRDEANRGILELLATRDWLLGAPSYQNLVIIDTINRHVLIRSLEALQNEGSLHAIAIKALEKLCSYHLLSADWQSMLLDERGELSEAQRLDLKENGDGERLDSLFSAYKISHVELHKLSDIESHRPQAMLAAQDFSGLRTRMVVTDYYLSSVVPALLEYWKRSETPSFSDDYARVKSILGASSLVPESVGAHFLERTRASAAVAELLQRQKAGGLRAYFFP